MKKSTLGVLLVAIALGGWVYYSEFRHPKPPATEENAPQALFHFSAADVAAVRLERADGNVGLERRRTDWVLTEPLAARADKRAADDLASALATATATRTVAAGAEQWKEFGLEPAAVTAIVREKGGQHRLRLGAKDFTGDSVYGVLEDGSQSGGKSGGAKEVLLLPASLLSSVTKSVTDLRDRSLLAFNSPELIALEIRRASGDFRIEKQGRFWNLLSPRVSPADDEALSTLTGTISAAQFADVASETPKDLGRYGLASPAITLHLKTDKGGEGTVLIGKKDDGKYFARDASRPAIFRVDSTFVDALDVSFAKLRDKHVVRFEEVDIGHMRVNNGQVTAAATRDAAGKWRAEEPQDRKGKEFMASRIFEALSGLRASEFLDTPPRAVVAKFEQPQVVVEFTDKSGKILKLDAVTGEGDAAYARTNMSSTVYKIDKAFFNEMKFSAAEIAP